MLDSTLQSFWSQPLLPNEARVLSPATQKALTEKLLLPHIKELETYLLTVRTQLDPKLSAIQPKKLGKNYPLGQCLEIAEAVQKRLLSIEASELPNIAQVGYRTMRNFLLEGGVFRLVWGDLRGQYFQNAFQLGTLYVDVANDTVLPTKPKIEILPFKDAQIVPIRDFEHFSLIANKYWQHEIYPNHVLPEIAPFCPLIHVDKQGRIQIHDATDYMLAMTRSMAFKPSEFVLRDKPMPCAVFDSIINLLQSSPCRKAINPEQGRRAALSFCQQYRSKRLHLRASMENSIKDTVSEENYRMLRNQLALDQKLELMEKKMSTIKIDDKEYDADSLSEEANTQLQNLRFVDQELARLQGQAAVLQTARTTYANALKAALPKEK